MRTQANSSSSRAAREAAEPLRIALYSPALPESGATNGIVTYARIMRDALRDAGHQVFVVTTESMEHPNGRVTHLRKLNRLASGLRMRLGSTFGEERGETWVRLNVRNAFEAVRRAGVQVFEMEESFGWAGQLTGKGVAIVERLHGPHIFVRDEIEPKGVKKAGDRRELAEFRSFSQVQAITSPTQRLLDELVPYGLDPLIARAIPNPIAPVAADAAWRLEAADPNQLLFVGRFDLCKGADVAIRAFGQAAAQNTSLKLVMAGPDNGLTAANGNKVTFNDFVAKEVTADVRSRIQFVGPLPPEKIVELRRQCALALVTSRFENFPYSIAEAMAAASPVITSATFGGTEMIRDGVDGFVVPIADVSATANAILKMTSDPALLARMGVSAHRRAADWLSPARIARETIGLYREALARV